MKPTAKKSGDSLSQHMEKLSATLAKEGYMETGLQHEKEYLLFSAIHRLATIRFISAVSILFPALVVFLVSRLSTTQMISELGSVAAGRLLQIGLVMISCVFLLVMIWLSNRYVLKIIRAGDGSIQMVTWRLLLPNAETAYHSTDFMTAPVYHKGKTAIPLKPVVNAPYYTIKVKDRKLLIDDQGDFPEGENALWDVMNVDITTG